MNSNNEEKSKLGTLAGWGAFLDGLGNFLKNASGVSFLLICGFTFGAVKIIPNLDFGIVKIIPKDSDEKNPVEQDSKEQSPEKEQASVNDKDNSPTNVQGGNQSQQTNTLPADENPFRVKDAEPEMRRTYDSRP
jgi:hypothetical protein